MKKGCIIALLVALTLLVLAGLALFIALRIANERVGLTLAPQVSHETLASPETRIRLLVKPGALAPFIAQALPPDMQIPLSAWVDPAMVLAHLLPREVAVMAETDVPARKIGVTLFVNEKRGGPAIARTARESGVFGGVSAFRWASQGLELIQRGVVVARADVDFPPEVEQELLTRWPNRSMEPAASVQDQYHAELVVDNRNGDLLALIGAVLLAGGGDWNQIRQEQVADMALTVIQSVWVARLGGNMQDKDTAVFDLRIDADPNNGPALHFLLSGVVVPELRNMLQQNHNLTLEGDLQWVDAEGAVLGKFTVRGLNAFIQANIPR